MGVAHQLQCALKIQQLTLHGLIRFVDAALRVALVGGNALRLLGVGLFADEVLVVELQELALLVHEPLDLPRCPNGIRLHALPHWREMGLNQSADLRALLPAELNRGVKLLDLDLDEVGTAVALRTEPALFA